LGVPSKALPAWGSSQRLGSVSAPWLIPRPPAGLRRLESGK